MTERYADIHDFDGVAVGEALAAAGKLTHDVAYGIGQHLDVGERRTAVEVFPDAAVARVTTKDARIELFRVPGYAVDAERAHVVFEQQQDDSRTRLIVRSNGQVSFVPAPQGTQLELPRTALAPVGASETTAPRPDDTTPVAPPAGPTESTTEPQDRQSESREPDSVTMQGRLGRDPWFRGGDQAKGGFPLAVNGAEGQTSWHKVVVFDDVADALREQARRGDVKKGRLVDVTGRTVVRDEEMARGLKQVTEFHATQVARVRATKQR